MRSLPAPPTAAKLRGRADISTALALVTVRARWPATGERAPTLGEAEELGSSERSPQETAHMFIAYQITKELITALAPLVR